MIGLIIAMWLGGTRLIPRYGKGPVASLGAWTQIGGYGLLVLMAWVQQPCLAPPSILVLGFGAGLFTVGGVSLMMDMTETGQTGLFVGAWTLASAMARGPASIAASSVFNAVRALGVEPAGAYAAVFIAAALCLVLAIYLLREVGVARFHREVEQMTSVMTQAID
jgi:BCD family chlorophyll transporter-like MFS transporter